jgi:hypothetical protein
MSRVTKFFRITAKQLGVWQTMKIRLSWYFYTKLVKVFSKFKNEFGKRNEFFTKNEMATGVLPHEELEILKKCISESSHIIIERDDYHQGFCFNSEVGKIESKFDKGFYFFNIKKSKQHIQKVFAKLAPAIRACLGHPFRIANVRSWELLPDAKRFGPNAWHTDGFPYQIFKLLIYISAPGKERGTTEVKLRNGETVPVEGPSGTWILFNSTKLTHRGIPPQIDSRTIIEVTIIPSFQEDPRPAFPGLNATHPIYPWNSFPY